MATIRCLKTCHFMVLSKDDYNRVIGAKEKRIYYEKINFLKNLPVFSLVTRTFLGKLTYYFEYKKCIKGAYLYKEGDSADHVFIVRSGEFEATKKIIHTGFKEDTIQSIIDNPLKANKHQNKLFNKNTTKQVEKINLCKIGQGNIIGEEDVCFTQNYQCSVQCISQTAEVIYIKKEDFLRLQSQQITWNEILKSVNEKKNKINTQLRQTRISKQRIEDQFKLSKLIESPQKSRQNDFSRNMLEQLRQGKSINNEDFRNRDNSPLDKKFNMTQQIKMDQQQVNSFQNIMRKYTNVEAVKSNINSSPVQYMNHNRNKSNEMFSNKRIDIFSEASKDQANFPFIVRHKTLSVKPQLTHRSENQPLFHQNFSIINQKARIRNMMPQASLFFGNTQTRQEASLEKSNNQILKKDRERNSYLGTGESNLTLQPRLNQQTTYEGNKLANTVQTPTLNNRNTVKKISIMKSLDYSAIRRQQL